MKTKHNMHITILCLIAIVIMTFMAGCTEEQVTQYIDEHPDEVANYVASHPDQINQYISEHPEVMNNITVPTTEPLIQQTMQQQTEEVSPTISATQSETTIPTSIPTTTETEIPTPIITTSPPTQTPTFIPTSTPTITVVTTTIVTTTDKTETPTTVPTTNPTIIVTTATPTPIPITMGPDGLPAIATVRHSWKGYSSNPVFVSAEMLCSPNGFLTNPDSVCTITGSSHEIVNSDGTVHKSYGSDSGISFGDSFKIHDNGDGTYTTPNEVTDFIMKNKTSKRIFTYSQLSETLTISDMDWIIFNHEV